MGTNYYWTAAHNPDACPTCGRADSPPPRIHIGKSSAGWCFALHVYPDDPPMPLPKPPLEHRPKNLDEWHKLFAQPGSQIEDEYDREYTAAEMTEVITKRDWSKRPSSSFDYAGNHAVPGPNNLVRAKIDGERVIGHGDGTWDLIVGKFS